MLISLLVFLLLLFYPHPIHPSSPRPDHSFIKPAAISNNNIYTVRSRNGHPTTSTISYNAHDGMHYFELTKPLQSDHLTPSCTFSITLLTSSAHYSPPSGCNIKWSHVALHIHATSGPSSSTPWAQSEPLLLDTNDVASLWLDGSELIRMSPPPQSSQPAQLMNVSWEVRKDITRYSSLLEKSNLSLALTSLGMSINESLSVSPLSYQANISIFYYDNKYGSSSIAATENMTMASGGGAPRLRDDGFYDEPANLVIPLSDKSRKEGPWWFRIENELDVHSLGLGIPSNTRRAILELYVSSHGDDEFWPSHTPNYSSLRTGRKQLSSKKKYGAFKEAFVTIDKRIVGSEVPLPVIYPGSINPLFWEPIVAIGAFDHPTYDIDLTPFLELMIDGETHEFGLGVSRSNPFWLVSGNLHLWLDDQIQSSARSVVYHYPALRIEQKTEFKDFERRLELRAKRKSKFTGWVKSSEGNFTTRVMQETELKNSIRFPLGGQHVEIEHEIESEREVMVTESETGDLVSLVTVKRKYPMSISTSMEKSSNYYSGYANVTMKEKLVRGRRARVYHNRQYASGWMRVRDEAVVDGSGRTEQNLKYRDGVGGGGCCFREAVAEKGRLLRDDSSFLCSSSSAF